MLESTFIHFAGIGRKTERRLWDAGIYTWDDLEQAIREHDTAVPGSKRTRYTWRQELDRSRAAWLQHDLAYFAARLPSNELFRIACSAPERTAFLDIETTGLSRIYHQVTMIGTWMAGTTYSVLQREDTTELQNALVDADCLITFNGTRFDLPFLRHHYPQLRMPPVHIDLMYMARRVGWTGGQKAIERAVGFRRPPDQQGRDGAEAPALWYAYTYGDTEAGRQLVEYNAYDIHGMRFILAAALKQLLAEMPPARDHIRELCTPLPADMPTEKANEIRDIPAYTGPSGPRIRLSDLALTTEQPLRVVGIDLSGSQKRPTGWCFLDHDHSRTQALRSDDEIIAATLAVAPDLISIDSPLSLPTGREYVSDDDPSRGSAGITRECERTLWHRGVSVYPCLIQSMQQLTARGMRLAETFRRHGIPVIESYPGAAQDIIGLPRKQNSLALLKRGLHAFGIEGDYLSQDNISHDEIDAITSALVGQFFWAGRFEALGNSDEDYLIVPDLRVAPEPWLQRSVIGISGAIGAGKTTTARYLAHEQNAGYWRYSSVLAELLKEKGQQPSRDTLQTYGQYVNEHLGQRWLCKQLARHMPTDTDAVVDGLRFPDDHAFMMERFGPAFSHLHITASSDSRLRRYVDLGNTATQFEQATDHRVEQAISGLGKLAHHTLVNDGSMDELLAKAHAWLQAIQSGKKDT